MLTRLHRVVKKKAPAYTRNDESIIQIVFQINILYTNQGLSDFSASKLWKVINYVAKKHYLYLFISPGRSVCYRAGAAFAGDAAAAAEPLELTTQMMVVMAVLVFVIALFVFEWVRVDVVGIIMMVLLPILGLVTPKEAISGLSSNAVVSIIAVIIIGAGLDKTGVMNVLARNILKFAGKAESRIIALISGTVAFISSFMQNIGAAALFMPAAIRVSRQVNVPVSRILMPMGFCAIVGGTITLVGASPTILLNDLLDQANQLGAFEKIWNPSACLHRHR